MGFTSLIWLICLATSLSSGQGYAVRARTRHGHHGRTSTTAYNINSPNSRQVLLSGAGTGQCEISLPPEIVAPRRNVWDHLSVRLGDDVEKWLRQQPELNLSHASYSSEKNYIYSVELMQPNKTDVLNYLDKNGTKPAVYASALLYHADVEPGEYRYVLVGPLPINNVTTTWQPLTYHLTRKDPVSSTNPDYNYGDYERFIHPIVNETEDIRRDLWNLTRGEYTITGAGFHEDDDYIVWEEYWAESTQFTFDTYDLLPLGLFYGASYNIPTKEWSFLGWLYNGVLYPTNAEFRAAYESPGLEKLPPNKDGHWAWTDQKGPILPLDDQAPPTPVASSARFSVEYREKYVEWMGWSFYISFHWDTGMAFHDIRFKGERIIYELGLQEALAVYAGNDPYQGTTTYFDAQYGLGISNELMAGYDCPTYATYLNITFVGDYTTRAIDAVCMFEFDADYPIQRHSYTSNTKNIIFMIRTVTTVGNYDYMYTYEFYMDDSWNREHDGACDRNRCD